MTEMDSSPSQMSDPIVLQAFVDTLLAGQLVKIPATTQSGAESIRQAVIDVIIARSPEPIEAFILGKPPALEVWVRRLHGGRPKVWGCSCGAQGTEEEMSKHVCHQPIRPR